MAVEIRCPSCACAISIADEWQGRAVTCPKCQLPFFAGSAQVQAQPGLVPLPTTEVPEVSLVKPPHPNFWFVLLWCLGFFVVTQIVPGIVGVVLFFILLATGGGLKPEQLMNAQALVKMPEYALAMLPAMLLSQMLSIAMAWLVIRLIVGKEWPRILALRWPSWSHVALAVMGLPGLLVVSMAVEALVKQVLPTPVLFNLEEMMEMFGKWPWPLAVLIIGVGPGIGEELWFRGFFGRGLVSRHGVVVGVLLTSLIFGAIHMEPRQAIPAGVIGVFLHLSYLASRSLLVPVMLHMANN